MLNSVLDLTFAWTSGAGGFSISPNFTYYPTVDTKSDPAFRIVELIDNCFFLCKAGNKEAFMAACLTRLARLFNEKKANPVAVGDRNETLMHAAGLAVGL